MKGVPKKSCGWLIPRSPRHPTADLVCGAPAKFIVKDERSGWDGTPLCGRHANTCAIRRIKAVPLLLAVIIMLVAGCAGTWDFTKTHEPQLRTSIAAADVALLTEDTLQSYWMVDHYHRTAASTNLEYHENNPVLGRYPSKLDITLYCGAWAGAVVAGRLWLPPWASWALSGAVFAMEVFAVGDDYINWGERPEL